MKVFVGSGGVDALDELNLIIAEFNLVVGFRNSISNTLKQEYANQAYRIDTIEDPVRQQEERLALVQSHYADYATPGSIHNVVNEIQGNLAASNAIDQAYKRFEAAREALWQGINQDLDNENLWVQYLSLLDGEDAQAGLEPESLQSLKISVSKGLEKARKNNRINQAYNRFVEAREALSERINQDPNNEVLWLEYQSLLDGEDAQTGLKVESLQSLKALAARRLEEAEEANRKSESIDQAYNQFMDAEKALSEHIYQDPNNEALWLEYHSLLDGEDARTGLKPESLQSLKDFAVRKLEEAEKANRRSESINQAYNRFVEAREVLSERINRDPNNEALWLEYQSLLDGEDARIGLKPESLQSLKALTVRGLGEAKEANEAYNRFMGERELLSERIDQDPDNEALHLEYRSLLDGVDAHIGLTPEHLQSLKDIAEAEEANRRSVYSDPVLNQFMDREEEILDLIHQYPDNEALSEEYEKLLDEEQAYRDNKETD